jgi:threonine dehydratase
VNHSISQTATSFFNSLLDLIRRGVDRIVEVSDNEIAEAVRVIYGATHNCAEGAGAAALAALLKERERLHGPAAVILSGQNIDRTWMQTVLAGGTPCVS